MDYKYLEDDIIKIIVKLKNLNGDSIAVNALEIARMRLEEIYIASKEDTI